MEEKDNKADRKFIEWIAKTINRSASQVAELLEILDYNFNEYFELEEAIKRFHYSACPDTLAECYYLLGMLRTWKACGWMKDDLDDKLITIKWHGPCTYEWRR